MLPFDCLVDVVVVGFRSALNSSVSDFRKVVLFVKVCWFFWGVMGCWGHAPDDIIALAKSSLML